jgi:hypothetical protein
VRLSKKAWIPAFAGMTFRFTHYFCSSLSSHDFSFFCLFFHTRRQPRLGGMGLAFADCLTEPGIVGLTVVGRASRSARPARDGQALRGPRRSFGKRQSHPAKPPPVSILFARRPFSPLSTSSRQNTNFHPLPPAKSIILSRPRQQHLSRQPFRSSPDRQPEDKGRS